VPRLRQKLRKQSGNCGYPRQTEHCDPRKRTVQVSKVTRWSRTCQKASQAKDDRIYNLMMKRKELEGAGFSAIEIDEHLPLSKQDDEDMPRSKKTSSS
jgi:hypothetical protein